MPCEQDVQRELRAEREGRKKRSSRNHPPQRGIGEKGTESEQLLGASLPHDLATDLLLLRATHQAWPGPSSLGAEGEWLAFPSLWKPRFSPKGLPWYLVGGGSHWTRSETGLLTAGLVRAFTVCRAPWGPRGLTAVPLPCAGALVPAERAGGQRRLVPALQPRRGGL